MIDRLLELGLETIRLPLDASQEDNHVPILVSKGIADKNRVLVLFGERNAEPGILSWRVMGEESIRSGSLVDFVNAFLSGPSPMAHHHDAPGIVITNPCQLLWYRGGGRAVSFNEWMALPRPTAVHEAMRVDEVKNKIPKNRDYEEHVKYIFEHVLTRLVKKEATLDIVGIEYPGSAAMEYLSSHCRRLEVYRDGTISLTSVLGDLWSSRITGMSLIAPQHKVQDLIDTEAPPTFINFLTRRCRAYFVTDSVIETPIAGREKFGCNCYSSGESSFQDSAMVRCWRHILDWFNMLHTKSDYEEPEFMIMGADGSEDVNLGWG